MTLALPTPATLLAEAGLGARKALGQHFLLDLNLCHRIVRLAAPSPGELVVEVGPGPGGLTRALLESGATVLAIEKDRRFIPLLEALAAAAPRRLNIVHADALAVDLNALGAGGASVVANLPYNVGGALLVQWLIGPFQPPRMTLMFQKEVAERISAAPGSRSYGRLTVLVQTLCAVRLAFGVPARAFTPAPKVDSAVVRLERRRADLSMTRLSALQRVTRAGFGQRRKMLRSALAEIGGEALCQLAGVDPKQRAEQLDLAAFGALAAALEALEAGTAVSSPLSPRQGIKENQMNNDQTGSPKQEPGRNGSVQGEGDYDAARRFDKDEEAFVKSGRVEENARKAAEALDSPEGEELEAARRSTAEGLAAPKDD